MFDGIKVQQMVESRGTYPLMTSSNTETDPAETSQQLLDKSIQQLPINDIDYSIQRMKILLPQHFEGEVTLSSVFVGHQCEDISFRDK